MNGCVETGSTHFVSGWLQSKGANPPHLFATLNDTVIGIGTADQTRPDLIKAAEEGGPQRFAFLIIFDQPINHDQVPHIVVKSVGGNQPLPKSAKYRQDRDPVAQIFIFGSPRSGTSELGNTIASNLAVPWFGECHAAPMFAKAADALSGDPEHLNNFLRFMAQQNFRKYAVERARFAYYCVHGSASFVDKTPGFGMIASAAFIYETFPNGKFIYVQRNGISNVLSRMVKFGGRFASHCEDWATAVRLWSENRQKLPHYLELRQEDMLAAPDDVARKIAAYLGTPDKEAAYAASLRVGSRERTGAGIDRDTIESTGWSKEQIEIFNRVCGPTMHQHGYSI